MPLIQSPSKKAFQKNVETEMKEHPMKKDQDLAIAYSIKKKNAKKMAYGGAAEDTNEPAVPMRKPDDYRRPEDAYMAKDWSGEPELDDDASLSMGPAEDEFMSKRAAPALADGGEMEDRDTIAQIMHKRRMRAEAMADGGMVDLNKNSEESLNDEDQYSFRAGLKEQYDDSQLSPQPTDSNELGDDIDSDDHDMVSRIRSKMKSRRM